MLSRRLVVLVLTLPLLAALPTAPAHDSNQIQWDLPCSDPSPTSSSLATLHTQLLSRTPGELAISGDRLLVSEWGGGGFRVYDLSNPVAPSFVGRIGTSGTTLDIKPSADGDTVFVGTTGRIHIVDVQDPSAPNRIRTVSLPVDIDQGHMLHDTVIDGTEYLLAASQSGSGVYIFEVTGTASNRGLTLVSQFAPGSALAAHDMYVHHDPVAGIPILYVANGFAGWIAADLSDPTLPVPLAVVPNADAGQSYAHSVQAQWVDGRRIVATIAELGANILRVWDATLINAPVLLAEWSVQSPAGVVPSLSSQHNIQIVNGQLFMAHYRCGFYVFDLDDLPVLPVPTAISPVAHFAPQVSNGQHWDLIIKDGYIYTSDMRLQNGGAFYVVGYSGLTAGDPAHSSTG